mmetsp:Transcript_14496/g.47315  ORF Transcript_14496/g.47315 Transcript_14496/m.47315 type:complete len:627 (-) Transcript_14496:332-2212(-)
MLSAPTNNFFYSRPARGVPAPQVALIHGVRQGNNAANSAAAPLVAHLKPTATSSDRGDGSYIITVMCPKKGKYALRILLDGEPVGASPIHITSISGKMPQTVKFLMPRATGSAPTAAFAASVAFGHDVYLYGGHDGSGVTGELHRLQGGRMKWSAPDTTGNGPPACAGAAAAIAAHTFLIYGGYGEAGTDAPLDCFHALDLKSLHWTRHETVGATPGPLLHAAAAAIGNKLYLFGGWTGAEMSNRLFVYSLSSRTWEPMDDHEGAAPEGRMNHSLVAYGSRLFLFGGKNTYDSGGSGLRDLWILDTAKMAWSSPAVHGVNIPYERWGHSSMMCGHNLVIALGSDNDRETNTISMLNTATLAWEAWDANVSRTGAAMHMVAAKMLLVGGTEGSEHSSEAMQFNIGNFMIEFDGVDDEIMIPHLPTIIPNAYTIEAWIRPAKAEAMSVIVRTNETYPQAAWSHQLRINDRGQFEHYCETDGDEPQKLAVSHTGSVTPGQWYHVAGVATRGGALRLYVNGKEEGQAVELYGGLRPGLDRYFIGAASGDGMAQFEGNVAEMRVWNYALGDDEIHDNYRKVLTGAERGIVGLWRINEGPGGMIFDLSNYNNIGPIKGDPKWTATNLPIVQK